MMITKNRTFLQCLYLVFFLVVFSCNSKKIGVEDIKGNWCPSSSSSSSERDSSIRYIEIYIDDNKFNYYDGEIGILPSKKFTIKNGTLFLENFKTNTLEKMGTIRISNDKLLIEDNQTIFILSRLDEKPTLQGLINNQVHETNFRKKLRLRMNKWNEVQDSGNGKEPD